MKIFFAADFDYDPNSGAAGTEIQIISELRACGCEVTERWRHHMSGKITHGNLHYLLELPKLYRKAIEKDVSRANYDVFHINQAQSYSAFDYVKSLGLKGICVFRSHGLDDHMGRVLRTWRNKLGLKKRGLVKAVPGMLIDFLLDMQMTLATRHADGIIVSSSIDKDYLVNHHGKNRELCAGIPQAASEFFLKREGVPMNHDRLKRILYVAGFNFAKDPYVVAKAFNVLAEADRSLHFTWVSRQEEQAQIKSLLKGRAQDVVELRGWMSQEELVEVYDSHGIFIYPSFFDGFAKVFLEAMARGLCVIGTPTGGMKDIIRNGENGFLVDFHSSASIVDKVHQLNAKFDLGDLISKQAYTDARKYSWKRTAREIMSFYKEVMEKKGKHVL